MIKTLSEFLDDLHVASGINAGPKNHLLEEIRANQTRTGESKEDTARSQHLHGQQVNVFIAPASGLHLRLGEANLGGSRTMRSKLRPS